MFREPSTRTRLSLRLPCKDLVEVVLVLQIPATSHLKGETLVDGIRMVAYGCSSFETSTRGLCKIGFENSEVPLINGGDGAGQHPTQTLLDLFTINEEMKN